MKKTAKPQFSARQIVDLLRDRHKEDVFVEECKDGPTNVGTGRHMRLDGWAMKKSWSTPNVWGYEVKVSRSDFTRDEKWRGYLPMCNSLYFVTAPDIALESEIPAECGWLVVSSNCAKLLLKKKAPYRDVTIPENVFRYILMCRARVGSEIDFENPVRSRRKYFEAWLKEKEWNHEVGYRVSSSLRKIVNDALLENRRLKEKHEEYEPLRAALGALGIKEWEIHRLSEGELARRVKRITEAVPEDFLKKLDELSATAQRVAAEIRGPVPLKDAA